LSGESSNPSAIPQNVPSSHDSTKACTVGNSFLSHALYNRTSHVSLASSQFSIQLHFDSVAEWNMPRRMHSELDRREEENGLHQRKCMVSSSRSECHAHSDMCSHVRTHNNTQMRSRGKGAYWCTNRKMNVSLLMQGRTPSSAQPHRFMYWHMDALASEDTGTRTSANTSTSTNGSTAMNSPTPAHVFAVTPSRIRMDAWVDRPVDGGALVAAVMLCPWNDLLCVVGP